MADTIRLPREEALEEYKKFLIAQFKKLPKKELAKRLLSFEMNYAEGLGDTSLSNLIINTTNKYGIGEKQDANLLKQRSSTAEG